MKTAAQERVRTDTPLAAAIAGACRKIAPSWPLDRAVAVNPFLGFSAQTFSDTCATFRRVTRFDMLMPLGFYRDLLARGVIEAADVESAQRRGRIGHDMPRSVPALIEAVDSAPRPADVATPVVATLADVLDALDAGHRLVSHTACMIDEISRWCSAYFDEGHAPWPNPTRLLRPYAAWRATMEHDLTAETSGIRGFRRAIASLPCDPEATIARVVEVLGIPESAVEDYLHRALFDIRGWAAYARYRDWTEALDGRPGTISVDLLAIRIAWGYAVFLQRTDSAFKGAWAAAVSATASMPQAAGTHADPELGLRLYLQEVYEISYQRRLIGALSAGCARADTVAQPGRQAVQAAFCIDVRSEVFRRALEAAWPDAETLGCAGFFGIPLEYVPLGATAGSAQCPVLMKPNVVVCEALGGSTEGEQDALVESNAMKRRTAAAWKTFKLSAISSFTYVEAAGLWSAVKIVGDSVGLHNRPQRSPRFTPSLKPRVTRGRITGLSDEQQLGLADGLLRSMSLTSGFARLVLLVGHGSTTTNNPLASSLDCGACGGHKGDANARVAAAILNDPSVREGLRARGISIPADTWFLAALHDTTTDEVQLFDLENLPASHQADHVTLREKLSAAASLARVERARLLGIPGGRGVDAKIKARSRDWSQVRPEWGLARNAAFIAAPRARTRGMNLEGRVFLHSYDWRQDPEFRVLELIMTAPLIVASWINLQYYGSTVNNRAFGSGNKTLHNIVGRMGVLEGNAGDLRVGLPCQSIHDGERFVHEPLRLTVLLEAPQTEIDRVIAKHASVRELVDNAWLHLFAVQEEGRRLCRYLGGQRWE